MLERRRRHCVSVQQLGNRCEAAGLDLSRQLNVSAAITVAVAVAVVTVALATASSA